ncbi:MAG: hypothetical protein JW836_11540 [Deltaproteobacteria bacterium]|nr:hypothetical protein [Deltaproteobacteria bacterium]
MSGNTDRERCVKLRESRDFFNAAKCFEQCGSLNEALSCDMEAIKAVSEADFKKKIEISLHAATLAHKMGDEEDEYNLIWKIAYLYLDWAEATTDGNQRAQAVAYLVKAGDQAVRMGELERGADDYLKASGEALVREDPVSAFSYARKAIDIALKVPPPKPAELLIKAYDRAGLACALAKKSLKPARVYWNEAKRYADELGTPYTPSMPSRHAQLKLDASPAALAVVRQDPQDPNNSIFSTITATLTEAMGRVSNCIVKFSVLKGFGAVIPAVQRTNKDGIATAAFFPRGKAGLCTVKGRARTGAKAAVDVKLTKAPEIDLLEMKWVYPNSLGLYGVKPEAPHWRKKGPRPIAHVFAGRGLNGSGRKPKSGLEIEITLALPPEAGLQGLPKIRVTGTARFKALPGTPASPLEPLVFTGEAKKITMEPQKISVWSSDRIPDAMGHYDVEITWSYEHPISRGTETVWAALGGATKTVNDLYITWKQPLPCVEAQYQFIKVGDSWVPEVGDRFQYGEPQFEDNGAARVYLECLRWSIEAILSQGDLNPDYLEKRVKDKECRKEIQILDRIFEYICSPGTVGTSTFSGRAREGTTYPWSAASYSHRALDVIKTPTGECGDWACFFHDLAAAQGIHVCLVALGMTDNAFGENFCMYPAVAETSRSMLPLVYDSFMKRRMLVNNKWKVIPGQYGLRTSRDDAVFDYQGGWLPYQKLLSLWLKDFKKPKLVEIWNPSTMKCKACREKTLKYYNARKKQFVIICPLCGTSIVPD